MTAGADTNRRHSFVVPAKASLEVMVWKHAVCWDTPDGPDATDPPFEDVNVWISPDGQAQSKPQEQCKRTDKQGKARFDGLPPGKYKIIINKPGYDDVTTTVAASQSARVQPRTTVEVKEGSISYADIVLRAKKYRSNADGTWTAGRECERRHAPKPQATGSNDASLGAIFWDDEPMLLRIRDTVWTICGLGMLLGLIAGLVSNSMLMLSVAGIAAALFGYLGGIIFGSVFGVVSISAALVMYTALLVVAFVSALLGNSGLPPLNPYGVGILTGIWTAFGYGYLGGRRDEWQRLSGRFPLSRWLPFFVPMLLAIAAAVAMAGLLLVASGQKIDVLWLGITVIGSLPLGGFTGFIGFAFRNEGEVSSSFGAGDFKLPYVGERYCLQGARGYWSHFDDEEGAYDWSMPYSTAVLCAKEGHIIAFDDREPYLQPKLLTDGTYEPESVEDHVGVNFMEVRHQDGSVARYEHFKTRDESEGELRPLDKLDLEHNPLHVRAGHELGQSGWPPAEKSDLPPTGSGIFWEGFLWAAGLVSFFFVLVLVYSPPKEIGFPLGLDVCPANGTKDGASNYDYTKAQWANPDRAAELDTIRAKYGGIENLDLCYCENFKGNYFQWSNTLSDLLFVVLGVLLIGLHCLRWYGPGKLYANRITATNMYTRYYGFIIIFMGPGSMLFHGTMHAIGGFFDGTSMYGLAGFLVAYNCVRLFNLSKDGFRAIFWGSVGLFAAVAIVIYFTKPLIVTNVMYAFVGVAFIFQFLVLLSRNIYHDGWGAFWFWLGGLFLIVASVIREQSQTGLSWCLAGNSFFNPDNHWLQGHAIWHMMSAIGLFFFYWYFAHEKSGTDFPRLHLSVREAPPPGPPVDAPAPAPRPGVTPPQLRCKPVKFADKDAKRDMGRVFSMRKYKSDFAKSFGPPPTPTAPAEFAPRGGGEHPTASQPLRA
jgi:hypothetical protein